MSDWTTNPPTKQGHYFAWDKRMDTTLLLVDYNGGKLLMAQMFTVAEWCPLEWWSHWMPCEDPQRPAEAFT